jgi:hypothetical protein
MPQPSNPPAAAALEAVTDPDELRTLRDTLTRRIADDLERQHGDQIVPGRRVRIGTNITPKLLAYLTGTTQASAPGTANPNRIDVLLDESSTRALRDDYRVQTTRRVAAPGPNVTRYLLPRLPVGSLTPADHDS